MEPRPCNSGRGFIFSFNHIDGQNRLINKPERIGGDDVRMKTFRRFLKDETAATAIEYGLIAAGIALAIIAVVNGLGTKLNTKFTSVNTSLK